MNWKNLLEKGLLVQAGMSLLYPGFEANSRAEDELSLSSILDMQVVTSSKKAERLDEAPATLVVVTADTIKKRGYEYLDEILRDLPAFDLQHVHGTWPTQWTQRGLYGDENKRTLVMIDGQVENNLFEGSVLGGVQYSLHNVDRVEVVYGPASALYGANAFAGVINVITKHGKELSGTNFQAGLGDWKTYFQKISSGNVTSYGLDYALSASVWNSNGPAFAERHPLYSNSYVDNAYSLMAKFKWEGFELAGYRYDKPQGEGLFSNNPNWFYGVPGSGPDKKGGLDNSGAGYIVPIQVNGMFPSQWRGITDTAYLKKEFKLMNDLNLTAQFKMRHTAIADTSNEIYDNGVDKNGNMQLVDSKYAQDNMQWTGEVTGDYTLRDDLDTQFGFGFDRSKIEKSYRYVDSTMKGQVFGKLAVPADSANDFVMYSNIGSYLQARYRPKLMEFTGITFGTRFDNNNIYGDTWNPRVGLVIKPVAAISLRALYGSAFRAPTNFENFSTTSKRLGNGKLKPEIEKSFEAGMSFAPLKNLTFDLSGFINDFSDIIAVVAISGGFNQYQNYGTGSAKGAQLTLTYKPLRDLTFFGNATGQYAEQNLGSGMNEVANIARWKGNFGFDWEFLEKSNLNITTQWMGRRSVATTNPIGYAPGYVLANAVLTSNRFYEKVTTTLRIDNIFGTEWWDPGMRTATGGYYAQWFPQTGRVVTFKMGYEF